MHRNNSKLNLKQTGVIHCWPTIKKSRYGTRLNGQPEPSSTSQKLPHGGVSQVGDEPSGSATEIETPRLGGAWLPAPNSALFVRLRKHGACQAQHRLAVAQLTQNFAG